MALTEFTDTLPNPATQTGQTLTTNMQNLLIWMVANIPEIAGYVETLVALASTAAWSSSTTYSANDAVYHNGHTYRCISGCTDVEPGVDSGWATYWQQLTFNFIRESVKTASFTAEVNKYVYVLNISSAITITIPTTGLSYGDRIEIIDPSGTVDGTNTVTFAGGLTGTIISVSNINTLIYSSVGGWERYT